MWSWHVAVSQNVCRVGCLTSDSRTKGKTCGCLPGTSSEVWNRRQWLPEAHNDWTWKLGLLLTAWNEEGRQGMVPFLLTRRQQFLHADFSAKSNTYAILGSQWPTWRALCVQGNQSHKCFILHHLRAAIKSEHHGLLSTGVLLLHDNTRPHTAHGQPSQLGTFILNVSFVCHTHLTSPLVNSIFLVCSRRLLV
jgi:hypothetical protein